MIRSRTALLALAFATAAFATTTGKTWRTLPVHYKVFAHTSINGVPSFQVDALPLIQAGFRHWTSGEVACTGWNVVYDGTFTSPTGLAALNPTPGSGNLLIWLGGADWTHDSATLALTTVTAYTATGEIIDADIEFNDNQTWKTAGSLQYVDVESIATHEAGHFLGLAHSPSSESVMYAAYVYGEHKVLLSAEDVNDVCGEYPAGYDAGYFGSFCSTDSSCVLGTGLVCRGLYGAPGSKICTHECTTQNCQTGYSCQTSEPDGGSKACLRTPGAPDFCRFCASGQECSTGICITDDATRHNWCSAPCLSNADCGQGYFCDGADGGSSSGLCAPTSASGCNTQCSTANDCTPGYACNAGRCEAVGQAGSRCEVTGYCGSCLMCVGSQAEAYCRACCGAAPGGKCAACGPFSGCASGWGCASLSDGLNAVCVPNSGVPSCMPCDAYNPCQDGMTCIAGRCHYACTTSHPGACGACTVPPGGSSTLCACPDEIAFTGAACGPAYGGGYTACQNGDLCLGSPSACYETCTTVGTACVSGGTCQIDPTSGQKICSTAGTGGGGRCGTCIGTTCDPGFICYAGRCYEQCNPNNPTCSNCMAVSQFQAVCACGDQQVASDRPCGAFPDGGIAACAPGAICTNGYCRSTCDALRPTCKAGQSCQLGTTNQYVCLPTDAGTVDAGLPDAGGGGGGWTGGCGCSTSGWAPLAIGALLAIAMSRRRRAPADR